MPDELQSLKSHAYRTASEALHRDTRAQDRHGANLRMLWACGLAHLIRDDFYGLFGFPDGAGGTLLDAGCGTGIEMRNLKRRIPGLRLYGIDISAVALAHAVADSSAERSGLYQSALETLPFADGVFDYVSSHEVIEHVEDPTLVLPELRRVLKPGGVCVIATPNGASLWVEHVRQRIARLLGRRGAPVGEDHVRPPSFWQREFERAGFVVEQRMFDGAAFEFLTYVAPSSWMTPGVRWLEPLRIVPIINLLLCDRVKYRLLRKAGPALRFSGDPRPVCALCRADLVPERAGATCRSGHRFGLNACGLLDFTALLRDPPELPPEARAVCNPSAPSRLARLLRRYILAVGCVVYLGFLGLLLPIGFLFSFFYQPLRAK